MKKRVVILNAPPTSGKDEAAMHLAANYKNTHQREFKAQLFKLTMLIWGVSQETWDFLYTRERKEIKTEILGGMSPREALIHTSEVVVKPNYGNQYFGIFAAKTLTPGVSVFSDGGFIEEVKPLIDMVGAGNIHVIRIKRPGYTFAGDSRSYLPDGTVPSMIDIDNDGSFEEFLYKIRQEYERWELKTRS